MHIGFVIYGSIDTLTGGYLYDKMVVEGLIELGHKVEIISLPSRSYFGRIIHGMSPRLHDRLLTSRFDILIQDELCHPTLFWVNRRLGRQAGPIILAVVHHTLSAEPRNIWLNKILAAVERLYLSSVQGFIFNSKTTSKEVAALVNHHCPEVIAYPAGDRFGAPLSPKTITARAMQPGRLELIFLGNVIPRKGLLPLLRALAEVDTNFWRLSIVGGRDFDHTHTSTAQKLAEELGITDSVRFLGSQQNEKLIGILETSHLLCMPYAYEGFGIAILEAMAFGLPAFGSTEGAAGETIRHGENGFLLAPGDLSGLSPILHELYHDRQKLTQLALAARETYLQAPGWQDAIATIESFLVKMKDDKSKK
jgi:glycosyltransferase involved in cell wall biosynthesis